MRVVVDKIPEDLHECIFGEMTWGNRFDPPYITCRIDGKVCGLEYDCYCEKLITLEDLNNGCD